MDTFFEQIISVKKDGKAIAAVIGIWLLAFILCVALFILPILAPISFIAIAGILFGAFKLSSRFNIEYEYIITNGSMDVDKIINRNSRKRMLSFELSNVSRLEKFNLGMLHSINQKELLFACNANDPDAYLMVAERDGKGAAYVVFAPDDRVKGAIVKFIPKFIANSAFK